MLVLPPKPETSYELPPAETHLAVCYGVVDIGTQFNKNWNKTERCLFIFWEFPNSLMTQGKAEGLPFSFHKNYTLSSGKKANLRKDLEAWRGKPFSEEDFGNFDLGKLLEKGCLIGITHNPDKTGRIWANMQSIMKLPKGMEISKPINPLVYFSLNDFKQDVFDALPEYIKNMITQSPEYKEIKGISQPAHSDLSNSHDDLEDSDIPF